jgi:hypothetical protein
MVQGKIGGAQERSFEEKNFGWSPYVEVLHSSWEHEDVSWPKTTVLVNNNEVRGSLLYFRMWYLPEGQGRLCVAWRAITTSKYSRLEMGWYKHGLHYGLTIDGPQVWFNLCNCRSTLQICPLHTHPHQLWCLKVCRDLHSLCVMPTRSSKDNNLWLRFTVYRSLLGATTRAPQDSLDP